MFFHRAIGLVVFLCVAFFSTPVLSQILAPIEIPRPGEVRNTPSENPARNQHGFQIEPDFCPGDIWTIWQHHRGHGVEASLLEIREVQGDSAAMQAVCEDAFAEIRARRCQVPMALSQWCQQEVDPLAGSQACTVTPRGAAGFRVQCDKT